MLLPLSSGIHADRHVVTIVLAVANVLDVADKLVLGASQVKDQGKGHGGAVLAVGVKALEENGQHLWRLVNAQALQCRDTLLAPRAAPLVVRRQRLRRAPEQQGLL